MHDPYLLPRGPHGCLLLHGFSGSPGEMRGLADHLAQQGFSVLAVRLAGHGGSPDELAAATRNDWLDSAEAGLHQLRERCPQVSIIGFSMGGALAILLAGKHQLARLVTLSTPLMLQGDWRLNALGVVRHFVPWYYMLEKANFDDPVARAEFSKLYPDRDLSDKTVQDALRKEARLSVGAIDELRRLLATARANLSAVRVPTLVMHGRNDMVAPLVSAELIMSNISSPQKELVWWDDTGHQMLVSGPYHEKIYRRVGEFLDPKGLRL
jgi:carboxylesterase